MLRCFQIPTFLAGSFLLLGPEFVLTFLPYSFVPILSGLQWSNNFWSHSLPRIARAFSAPDQNFSLPIQSSYHIISPTCCFLHFLPHVAKNLALCIIPASSCACCLFHIPCNDTSWSRHITPFDALFPLFSCPRKSMFLLAAACGLHSLSIPPPNSEASMRLKRFV